MTQEFPVKLGWNAAETEDTTLRAADYFNACVEARRGWGKAWTYVLVTDPLTRQELNVAVHRSHGNLTPEQWVTQALAPPVEVAMVSIDQFIAAFQPQVLGFPGETANRPVWIVLNGMLYAPAQIGLDAEFGGIMIIPAAEPSGTFGMAPTGADPQ